MIETSECKRHLLKLRDRGYIRKFAALWEISATANMTSPTVCAAPPVTAFDRFFAATACAHLIFHNDFSVMMKTFVMTTHLETLTTT